MVEKLLCDLLAAWCKENKIAPASADELLAYVELARDVEGPNWKDKRDWLKAYCALWDVSMKEAV